MVSVTALRVVDKPPFRSRADAVAHYSRVARALGVPERRAPRPSPPPPLAPPPPVAPWSAPALVEVAPASARLELRARLAYATIAALKSRPSVREIIEAVAAAWCLDVARLRGPSRTVAVVVPRQVAMALARRITGQTYPEIGLRFRRDHTTVIYADQRFASTVARIIAEHGR